MTHDQCRQKICILCLEKKKSVGPISPKVRDLIKDHIPGLENFENDERLPNAICARCRQALTQSSKRHLLLEPKEYSKFTVTPSIAYMDMKKVSICFGWMIFNGEQVLCSYKHEKYSYPIKIILHIPLFARSRIVENELLKKLINILLTDRYISIRFHIFSLVSFPSFLSLTPSFL